MALSFVGQDLCNQSFRGRKDLAGADFTDADLRGCDFRDAILIGANFTGTKTGQSIQQSSMRGAIIASGGSVAVMAVVAATTSFWPLMAAVMVGVLGRVISKTVRKK